MNIPYASGEVDTENVATTLVVAHHAKALNVNSIRSHNNANENPNGTRISGKQTFFC